MLLGEIPVDLYNKLSKKYEQELKSGPTPIIKAFGQTPKTQGKPGVVPGSQPTVQPQVTARQPQPSPQTTPTTKPTIRKHP